MKAANVELDAAPQLGYQQVPPYPFQEPLQPTVQTSRAVEATPSIPHTSDLDRLEWQLRESVAALARATADLETERGARLRSDARAAALASQLQDAASGSVRGANGVLDRLRGLMENPLNDLHRAACVLLAADLPEPARDAAGSVLESMMLLRMSLHEAGSSKVDYILADCAAQGGSGGAGLR